MKWGLNFSASNKIIIVPLGLVLPTYSQTKRYKKTIKSGESYRPSISVVNPGATWPSND